MSRQDGKLQDGIAQPVRFEPKGYDGGPIDADTVAIIAQGGGSDSWLLNIYADSGVGMTLLGRIRTLPWRAGRRTLAVCAHPGARAWEVTGTRVRPVASWPQGGELPTVPGDPAALSDNDRLGIWLTSTTRVGGPWGITPIRGFAEQAKSSRYAAGTAGAFTLRGNVLGWSAFNSNLADGSVSINGQTPRVVPAGGGVVQGGPVIYLGYGNFFNFVGTSDYVVEYEVEDPIEGAGA